MRYTLRSEADEALEAELNRRLSEYSLGQGIGVELLGRAEAEARRRGCLHALVDTFTFQAQGFYARHGYELFGELPDFPAGHGRRFLWKRRLD